MLLRTTLDVRRKVISSVGDKSGQIAELERRGRHFPLPHSHPHDGRGTPCAVMGTGQIGRIGHDALHLAGYIHTECPAQSETLHIGMPSVDGLMAAAIAGAAYQVGKGAAEISIAGVADGSHQCLRRMVGMASYMDSCPRESPIATIARGGSEKTLGEHHHRLRHLKRGARRIGHAHRAVDRIASGRGRNHASYRSRGRFYGYDTSLFAAHHALTQLLQLRVYGQCAVCWQQLCLCSRNAHQQQYSYQCYFHFIHSLQNWFVLP